MVRKRRWSARASRATPLSLTSSTAPVCRFTATGCASTSWARCARWRPNWAIAGRLTEEAKVYDYIFTQGNYTRSQDNNDNDVGPNSRTAYPFTTDNLNTAYQTIATAKDKYSGAYFGCTPNTIVAGPLMNVEILQLLNRTEVRRTATPTGAEDTYGTTNPYRGFVNRIIISPWVLGRNWMLCDSTKMGFKFLTVEDWDVNQASATVNSETWRINDVIEYLISGYFGLGFVDDRPFFLALAA